MRLRRPAEEFEEGDIFLGIGFLRFYGCPKRVLDAWD